MVMYTVHMNLLCIYRAHELTKFIKNLKKLYMFFSYYSIYIKNLKVKLIIVYL
jgi:hypothetical protein